MARLWLPGLFVAMTKQPKQPTALASDCGAAVALVLDLRRRCRANPNDERLAEQHFRAVCRLWHEFGIDLHHTA